MLSKTANRKKGNLKFLHQLALGIVVAVVLISMGAYVVTEFQDEFTSGTAAYNVTVEGIDALGTMANFLPIIALVGVIVLVILFIGYLRMSRTGAY